MDRCVQRLRKRILHESWEKQKARHYASADEKTIGDRTPSFFTSPSLVNLGGLNVGDQQNIKDWHHETNKKVDLVVPSPQPACREVVDIPDIEHSGWDGMGLRGNRNSIRSLNRSQSDGSGLFIEEEDGSTRQDAGEDTIMPAKKTSTPVHRDSSVDDSSEYIKTTTMAHFYYRKNPSFGSLDGVTQVRL